MNNRNSQDNMFEAINLYLRSRNSYRVLREILVLSCPNTVPDDFEEYSPNGCAHVVCLIILERRVLMEVPTNVKRLSKLSLTP